MNNFCQTVSKGKSFDQHSISEKLSHLGILKALGHTKHSGT